MICIIILLYTPMQTYIILSTLFLLIRSQSQNQTDLCQQIINNWKLNYSSIPGVVSADSGKFLNDLGDYNNCNFNQDNYTYITLSVINRLIGGMQFTGFCLPNQCTPNVLQTEFATKIQNDLNSQYQKATGSKGILFSRLTFTNPITATPTFHTGNYVVVAIFSLLIILGIVGTIISLISNSEAKSIKLLKTFSIYDNFKKIITIGHAQNQNLLFINGLRVISIVWVIFGHDQFFRFINIKNWTESFEILSAPGLVTLIPAAFFAVDTFFWIGGFLITITLLQKMMNMEKFKVGFFLGLILHRFVRIWPTYLIAILFFWKIAPLTMSGPIWPAFQFVTDSCNHGKVIWNLVFLDNFGDHGPSGRDYCFGWGWYLANDFQFFLITPFIFLLYVKNKKWGLILTVLLFLSSIIVAFVLIMVNDWRYPIPNPKMAAQPDFMDQFYYRPYIRISVYIMGIWSGMFYLEWKKNNEIFVKIVKKITESVTIRILLYIFGVAFVNITIWVIIPFQQGENWSTVAQAFYNSLNRVFFIIGVILCTFPAMYGCKNDPCHIILGSPIFSPIAKVSFCMYLCHFIVIMMGTFSNRMDLYWQPMSSMYAVISDVVWSIILATILSLLVESPILGMQKILLRDEKKSSEQKVKKIEFEEDKTLSNPLLSNIGIENRLKINQQL